MLVPGRSAKDSTYPFMNIAVSGELGGETSSLYDVVFG
jgi:hypothetical protein